MIPVYSMKIALDTALGKEAFVNVIVALYVAPYYLVSLCERLEEPAASMFKAEDVKKRGHFLSKRWYIIYDTLLQYVAKVSKLFRHRFILKKDLDSSLRQHSTVLLLGPNEETNNV